jgi:hypothetical protein
MKPLLTDRELATVLAALRYWQHDLVASLERGEGPIAQDHFDATNTPLSPGEIDDLCERLNCPTRRK